MKLYCNWMINEDARAKTKGEHTNERMYVRDRPYIPSTTLLCEGIMISVVTRNAILDNIANKSTASGAIYARLLILGKILI